MLALPLSITVKQHTVAVVRPNPIRLRLRSKGIKAMVSCVAAVTHRGFK